MTNNTNPESFKDFTDKPRILPWEGAPSFYSTPTTTQTNEQTVQEDPQEDYPAIPYNETPYSLDEQTSDYEEEPEQIDQFDPAGIPFVQFDPVVLDTSFTGNDFDATGF